MQMTWVYSDFRAVELSTRMQEKNAFVQVILNLSMLFGITVGVGL